MQELHWASVPRGRRVHLGLLAARLLQQHRASKCDLPKSIDITISLLFYAQEHVIVVVVCTNDVNGPINGRTCNKVFRMVEPRMALQSF